MSWLRHGDTHLLTVGLFTFTLLDRFSAIHRSNSEDWVLEIRNTQHSDQGRNNKVWVMIIVSLGWDTFVILKRVYVQIMTFHLFHIIILDIIPLPQKHQNQIIFFLFYSHRNENSIYHVQFTTKILHALEQYWQVQVLIIIILGVSHIVCKEKKMEENQVNNIDFSSNAIFCTNK